MQDQFFGVIDLMVLPRELYYYVQERLYSTSVNEARLNQTEKFQKILNNKLYCLDSS